MMKIRDILVLLDRSEASDARLAFAAQLAARNEAHLVGAALMDIPMTAFVTPMGELYAGGLLSEDILAQMRERARAATAEIEGRFQDCLGGQGLTGEWHLLSGTNGDELARLARITDLVVLGQIKPEDSRSGLDWTLIESVLFASGRPILLVPFIGALGSLGETVLIGWNGSREATRAVHDALPLLVRARAVTLLSIDAPDNQVVSGADMAAHLTRHGVPVKAAQTVSAGLGISDVLLSYGSDMGADLIVAGGYGHSRLREVVLGGATRGLLRHMTMPVLLSH